VEHLVDQAHRVELASADRSFRKAPDVAAGVDSVGEFPRGAEVRQYDVAGQREQGFRQAVPLPRLT
jgi:hypothetical protein